MINPLKLPLLHNTAQLCGAEGLIFAGPGLSSIMGRVSFLYKDGPRGVRRDGGGGVFTQICPFFKIWTIFLALQCSKSRYLGGFTSQTFILYFYV